MHRAETLITALTLTVREGVEHDKFWHTINAYHHFLAAKKKKE